MKAGDRMASGTLTDRTKKRTLRSALVAMPVLFAGIFFGYGAMNGATGPSFVVEGLNDHDRVVVSLKETSRVLSLESDSPNHQFRFLLPPSLLGRYTLDAAIQSGQKTIDILFNVDAGRQNVRILADGFAPRESFSVKQGRHTILSGLHFDWAGRIEIDHAITDRDTSPLCLVSASGLSVCHSLAKGTRA